MRNGEGVRHVIRVRVVHAAGLRCWRASLGKAVVNAPLFKCAVAGNDPNVGRLVQAIGKHVGAQRPGTDLSRLRLTLGGIEIFSDGAFRLDPAKESALVAHLRSRGALRERARRRTACSRRPSTSRAHERCVEIEIDLGRGRRRRASSSAPT